jgi:predicted extracellular nuclease
MLISFPQTLVVTDHFNLGRFGELILSVGGRLQIPTQIMIPGVAANAFQALNERNQILLDDGSNQQWLSSIPYLDGSNIRRLGDSTVNLTGVLSFGFSSYRLQPTRTPVFSSGNPRTAGPQAVGGNLRLASFNVLNYFTSIDNGVPLCAPAANLECRGADNINEFNRQRDKIVSALAAVDADIVGLIEIENNASASLQDLTAALNIRLGAGTYTFLDTGSIGTDAIKVGLLYNPAVVSARGTFQILDNSVDPTFSDTKNRPALAQTFRHNDSGEVFTVSINHFKSVRHEAPVH